MDDDAFSLDDYLEAHAPTDQSDALVLVHRDERTRWAFAQSLPPPRTLAQASSSASIVDVGAGTGVGLFASRGVGGGAVVARAAPIAHAARGDGACCDVCLSPADAPVACRGGCGGVVYCRACSSSARAARHIARGECAALRKWKHLGAPPPSCLLASRVLRAMADGGVRAYVERLHRASDEQLARDDGLTAAAEVAARLAGSDAKAAAAVLGALRRNAHSVCDEELREVGVALYPREITAANHSCAPTIWPRFARAPGAPPTLEYVALRSLDAGAELCHEYLDLATPDRRAALRRGYGFQCACAVCVGGGPSLDGVRERRGAMEAAIAARDWPAAAREAEALAHLEDRFVAGHPYVAVHRLRCAKLRRALGDDAAAQRHAVLAKIRLDTSHGRGSALAREAADLVRDLDDDDADFDWRAAVPRRGA